jgi:hypothetical protein
MAAPTRFTSGFTQAAKWQPLGEIGVPDPFFYATYEDDFLPYNAANYTVTAASGSVAGTATNGNGGRILFTTNTAAASFAEIQLPVAGLQYTAGKKLAYLARIQVAAPASSNVIAGLCATTATPFAAITDGIYFSVTYGSPVLSLVVRSASVTQFTLTLPISLTANTDIDVGFYVDRLGNIKAFAGNNLEGAKRQDFATLGPNSAIPSTSIAGGITAVLLNPTLAISNGATAAPETMVADFQLAAMER